VFPIQSLGDVDLYAFSVDSATNVEMPALLGTIVVPPTVALAEAPSEPITLGDIITLTATVSQGAPPFSYEWTKNGSLLATTASMTDAPAADATYAVTVTDGFGLQSNIATVQLTVASGGGGGAGCDGLSCPPPPNATPELDSFLLFGSGVGVLAAFRRWGIRRLTRPRPSH
jgi:hypothetical protein